jgi:hypothetical protein
MSLVAKGTSARKFRAAKLVVLLSDCKRESGSEIGRGDTGEHPTSILDFFRAISAGECLVVSILALCGAKPNSLAPLGPVVLLLLKITT